MPSAADDDGRDKVGRGVHVPSTTDRNRQGLKWTGRGRWETRVRVVRNAQAQKDRACPVDAAVGVARFEPCPPSTAKMRRAAVPTDHVQRTRPWRRPRSRRSAKRGANSDRPYDSLHGLRLPRCPAVLPSNAPRILRHSLQERSICPQHGRLREDGGAGVHENGLRAQPCRAPPERQPGPSACCFARDNHVDERLREVGHSCRCDTPLWVVRAPLQRLSRALSVHWGRVPHTTRTTVR